MIRRRELLAAGVGAWLAGGLGSALWLGGRPLRADGAAFAAPAGASVELGEHLLARLAFGARPGEREALQAQGVDAWLEQQLAPEDIADPDCARRLRRLLVPALPSGECFEFKPELVAAETTLDHLLRAVHSRRQLQERVVAIWLDHFALSLGKGECAWLGGSWLREAIRPHALGPFRALVAASLRHPAMLTFLDGRRNRADAGAVNENHGRELLELHTLGVDAGYSQHDVREAARCLSGWTVRGLGESQKGSVHFVPARHDDGPKQILGCAIPAGLGAADVDRLVELLCADPRCHRFIARRLCRHLYAGTPPADLLQAMATALAGGSVADALRVLARHPAFRAPAQRRALLRRPFELLAAALRATDASWEGAGCVALLAELGHQPLHWPTPDGYPTAAEHWQSGLLARWRAIARLLDGSAGVRIDAAALARRCGDREALAAHCLGRRMTASERSAIADTDPGTALGLILASPGFQRC